MKDIIDVIKSRRSVRSYKSEQISKDILNQILEAGIYAPSANNKQSWHFTVIQNRELLQYINQKAKSVMVKSDNEWIRSNGINPEYSLFYHAPVLIIVSGRIDNASSIIDCSAATQNMMLAAQGLGIGSVWLGMIRFFFQSDADISKLQIPEGYQPHFAFALGYPEDHLKLEAPERNRNVIDYLD